MKQKITVSYNDTKTKVFEKIKDIACDRNLTADQFKEKLIGKFDLEELEEKGSNKLKSKINKHFSSNSP